MELAIIILLFVFIMLNSKIIEGKINFKKGFKKIGHGIKKAGKKIGHGIEKVGKDIGHGIEKVGKDIAHGLGKIFNVINLVKEAKNDYKTIKSGCV